MAIRNFNNVTTLGALTGPVSSSATTVVVTNFSQYPTVPFTVTIDRNTATEEIVLVTAVAGSTLTVTRGYDGTAPIGHLAGGAVEHTAIALDFAEANTHVNATTNVHGVAGELVGTEGSQTILDKTFVGNVHMADVAEGDAVVAVIPTGAGTRNLFRGVGLDGADKITVDGGGNIVSAGVAVTTAITGATSSGTANALVKRDGSGNATFNKAFGTQVPTAINELTRKDYVDTADTAALNSGKAYTDAQLAAVGASAATNGALVRRDAAGRAQFVSPSVSADAATKGYVDGKFSDTGWTNLTLNAAAGFSVSTEGARYRVKNGICYFQIHAVKSGSFVGNDLLVTMPSGARPAFTHWPQGDWAGASAECKVSSNGEIRVTHSAPTSAGVVVSASYPID